jgi:hypothetical protein
LLDHSLIFHRSLFAFKKKIEPNRNLQKPGYDLIVL